MIHVSSFRVGKEFKLQVEVKWPCLAQSPSILQADLAPANQIPVQVFLSYTHCQRKTTMHLIYIFQVSINQKLAGRLTCLLAGYESFHFV